MTQGDGELQHVLQEVAGACLDAGLTLSFFVILAGDGANGKSVFLAVLRALLGATNCSAVGMGELANNRFATFSLLGKLANIVGDQSYVHLDDEARLKQLTGGDLVSFEQKAKDPIFAVNTAKMIFSANTPPTFSDKSDAVWRRLVLVPFAWRVPVEDGNPELLRPEYWADELPGILLWALAGLARLRAAGQFTRSQACEAAAAQHRRDSDPAREYLADHLRVGPAGGFVATADIHRHYAAWRREHGYTRPIVTSVLGRIVRQLFPAARPGLHPDGSRRRGWCGLARRSSARRGDNAAGADAA